MSWPTIFIWGGQLIQAEPKVTEIKSKKVLIEGLKKQKLVKKETFKVPLNTMVKISNRNVENFIEL